MFYPRPANERGHANFGWLDSRHSFSFGSYYDPKHMGFSALRVINDDKVTGGAGFETHGHRDMEIISYVLKGSIEHQDSTGNNYVIPEGEVQIMSAGKGIQHSEFNHSETDELRFLQIWIQPKITGIDPAYEQKKIEQNGVLTPLVTGDGRDGSLTMNQDASIYRLQLAEGESISLDTHKHPGYLHVISGELEASSEASMTEGDGLGVFEETLEVKANSAVTALWFELPAPKAVN